MASLNMKMMVLESMMVKILMIRMTVLVNVLVKKVRNMNTHGKIRI